MRVFITLLLFPFFCLSCTSVSTNTHYKDAQTLDYGDFGEPVSLKGEELVFDEQPLKPVSLTVIDTLLLVRNLHSETLFGYYDVKNGRKIGEGISFGSGPEEMIAPRIVQNNDSMVWILDSQLQKLCLYRIDSLCSGDTKRIKEISFRKYIEDIKSVEDNLLVALVYAPGHKLLTFYNMHGDSISTKGELPQENTEIDPLTYMGDYTCGMTVSEKGKILVAYKLTDLIELYDTKGNLLKRLHGPDHFYPFTKKKDYGEGMTQAAFVGGETREAYFFPTSVDNRFFVLYSGRYTGESKETNVADYLLGDILVFDDEGMPFKRYKLDIPIMSMTVDAKSKTIYGITDVPDFRIIKFRYP